MQAQADFGVYTVLLGGYETLTEQPIAPESGVPFVCFTNDPELTSSTWEIRQIVPLLSTDSTRSSRAVKIVGYQQLPEWNRSLYIDNAVRLTAHPRAVLDALLPSGQAFGCFQHSFRGALDDEFDEVIRLGYDSAVRCEEQRAHYRACRPEVLGRQTLWTGVVARSHGHRQLDLAMETWLAHVLRYSRRDQLSLPFVLAEVSLPSLALLQDNNQSPWHVWPVQQGRRVQRGGVPWSDEDESVLRKQIQELELALEDSGRRLTELTMLASTLERRMVSADAACRDAIQERNHAIGEVAALTERARLAEELIGNVLGSRSWLVTRPLRTLSSRRRR